MARGFNTTFGIATTDRIQTRYSAQAPRRSYSIWIYDTSGSGDAGSYFDKSNAGVQHERLINAGDGTGSYQYKRLWSGGLANWGFPKVNPIVWNHIGVTYSDLVTTAPLMYFNGIPQVVTEYAAASGSATNNTDSYWIGNRGNGDRCHDGMAAEFAIWNRILSPADMMLLANCWSPLLFPAGLVEYVPLDGTVESKVRKPILPVVTGTKSTVHPRRIIQPVRPRFQTYKIEDMPQGYEQGAGGWIGRVYQ